MTANFRVEWTPEADEHLAAVWLAANDRAEVTAAVQRVDALLRLDPSTSGTELHEGLRVMEVEPVRAIYEVVAEDRLVTVVAVWHSTSA